MSLQVLRARVEQRDHLAEHAEAASGELRQHLLDALSQGEGHIAKVMIDRHHATVVSLVENLRIYQAELHAQADELAASQERTDTLLARFTSLFSNLPLAAMVVSFNGELHEFNRAAEELFHFRSKRTVTPFLHRLVNAQQYQDKVRPMFLEARGTGHGLVEAVDFITDTGQHVIADLHLASIPKPGAHTSRNEEFVCVIVDRTEQIRQNKVLSEAREALRTSEAFLEDSARLAGTGGWEYLPGQGTVHWSRQVRSLFEIDDGAQPSLAAMLALCGPASANQLSLALDSVVRTGEPFEVTLDMVNCRGQALKVIALGHRQANAEDDRRVLGVFKDVTLKFEADRRIHQLTERLSVANDAGSIGIWDWDIAADQLFFDTRMCSLLGTTPPAGSDLLVALRDCLDAEGASQLHDALQHALADAQPLSVEVRVQRSDPERWVLLSGRAQFDAWSKPIRVVGCAWDCTLQKQAARMSAAKEAAELASRSKSAFLSRMSHELRTPLNAILGFSQVMRLEAQAGDLVVKPNRVALIESSARHLLDLINEVLDVTRIESGAMAVHLATHDVHEIVRDCLDMLQGQADDAKVSLTLVGTTTSSSCTASCDRLRLKEVVINLLSNAVKYNRPQGRVEVSTRQVTGGVDIVVADTGVGLNERQLAGLFQPFERLGAESRGVEGSGMGLFVSRRFVELMGGHIDVSSQCGVGTTVTVWLPAAQSLASAHHDR